MNQFMGHGEELCHKCMYLIFYLYIHVFILGRPITIFVFLLGAQQNKSKNMYDRAISVHCCPLVVNLNNK